MSKSGLSNKNDEQISPSEMYNDPESQDSPISQINIIKTVVDDDIYNNSANISQLLAFFRYIIQASQVSKRNLIEQFQYIRKESYFKQKIERQEIEHIFDEEAVVDQQKINYLLNQMLALIRERISGKKKNGQLTTNAIDTLAIIFKINQEYDDLITQDKKPIFTLHELATIFRCPTSKIMGLKEIYNKRKNRITERVLSRQRQIIFAIAIGKLKLILLNCLKKNQVPQQRTIQQIYRKYAIKKAQQKQKTLNPANYFLPFSQAIKERIGIMDISKNLKQKIKQELKKIVTQNLQVDQALNKISEQFIIEKKSLINQYRKIITKKQKKPKTVREIAIFVHLFNYYRYKYYFDSMIKLVNQIEKKEKQYQSTWTYQTPQIQSTKVGIQEQNIYCKIISELLNIHLQHQQVLFLDHIEFYQHQFHLYNRKIDYYSAFSKYEAFQPQKDCLFSLIAGCSNRRILFHSVLNLPLSTISYFQRITFILMNLQDYPKVIVFYHYMNLTKDQFQALDKLIKILREKQIRIYILPNKFQFNITRHLLNYVKVKAFGSCSRFINDGRFNEKIRNEFFEQFLFLHLNCNVELTFSILKDMMYKPYNQSQTNQINQNQPILNTVLKKNKFTYKSAQSMRRLCYKPTYFGQKYKDQVIFYEKNAPRQIASSNEADVKLNCLSDSEKKIKDQIETEIRHYILNYAHSQKHTSEFNQCRFYRLGLLVNPKETGKTSYRLFIVYRFYSIFFINQFLLHAKDSQTYMPYQNQIIKFVSDIEDQIKRKNKIKLQDEPGNELNQETIVNRFEEDKQLHIYLREKVEPLNFWNCIEEFKIHPPEEVNKKRLTGRKKQNI